jgi:alpha-beta hydrolase superfamily lysophospholipase
MIQHDEGYFSARDGLRLFWQSDVPAGCKAHVAVIHGYGDHGGRYRQMVAQLAADGFACHALDYRGHGRADGRRGYVDRFEDYLSDVALFMDRCQAQAAGKKLFLFAHSLGGLLSIHHLKSHADGLAGAVLSGPYLELALQAPAFKVMAAKVANRVLPWLPIPTEIKTTQLTRDAAMIAEAEKDPLYLHVVTPRFFIQSSEAQPAARAAGPDIRLPLLLVCGAEDPIASTRAMRTFFDGVASADKTFKAYPGMLHEPWNEQGREEVYRDISLWISAHL